MSPLSRIPSWVALGLWAAGIVVAIVMIAAQGADSPWAIVVALTSGGAVPVAAGGSSVLASTPRPSSGSSAPG